MTWNRTGNKADSKDLFGSVSERCLVDIDLSVFAIWEVMIWTNDDPAHWHTQAPAINELKSFKAASCLSSPATGWNWGRKLGAI